MKKKIGEIYNKPIVTGDKNLVTKNEIHESTLKGGGSSAGKVNEDEYVYMKIVSPFDNEHELFWKDFGSLFPISTIIDREIDPYSHAALFDYCTAIHKCIKSIAGIIYVQESGDGSAGLGGKLTPWDLSVTINNDWTGYSYKEIRAIQFYKNTDNLGYSFSESVPNPNYTNFCINNDNIFKKSTEYFKNKVIEYFKNNVPEQINIFSEYETINIFIFFTVYFIAISTNPDLLNKDMKDVIDSIIEILSDENLGPVTYSLMCLQKNSFVEITKEEYDNICIDAMKSQRTSGEWGPTIYEAFIENENMVNEMFK